MLGTVLSSRDYGDTRGLHMVELQPPQLVVHVGSFLELRSSIKLGTMPSIKLWGHRRPVVSLQMVGTQGGQEETTCRQIWVVPHVGSFLELTGWEQC